MSQLPVTDGIPFHPESQEGRAVSRDRLEGSTRCVRLMVQKYWNSLLS